ncbi:Alb1 domain-containing protein [Trichoderma aethiopicum]
MAKTQNRPPSKRSRAARRATSPSINTDKSLKEVSLPTSTHAAASAAPRPSVLAARHSAGVTKKSKRGRQLSARGRRRQEKGLEMAEAFVERKNKKLEKSLGKARVVQSRAKKWDDINKDAEQTRSNAFEVLRLATGEAVGGDDDKEGETKMGEWETDDEVDGETGAGAVESAGAAPAVPVVDEDDDLIL